MLPHGGRPSDGGAGVGRPGLESPGDAREEEREGCGVPRCQRSGESSAHSRSASPSRAESRRSACCGELNVLSDLRGKRVSNVAELLDAGHTRDRAGYFVVTAFVDGCSLQAVLDEEVQLGLPTTVAMIRGLANGLAALHRMGIVHRAIKPPSIMIPKAGPIRRRNDHRPCAARRLSTSTTESRRRRRDLRNSAVHGS